MKKTSFMFVAALAIAAVGCKKSGPDCTKAIDNSMAVSKADMEKMGVDAKTLQKMTELGLQHCKDDKWPDDAIKCMAEAKAEADARGCYGKLSHEQQEKMNQAAMDMAKSAGGAAGAGSAATGSAVAPAGSADTGGSAGSAAAPK